MMGKCNRSVYDVLRPSENKRTVIDSLEIVLP